MLHIIWIILKIILLILAVVLGLALLILALLLLVPVRYEAHLKKKEEFFVGSKGALAASAGTGTGELSERGTVGEAEGTYFYREGFSGG